MRLPGVIVEKYIDTSYFKTVESTGSSFIEEESFLRETFKADKNDPPITSVSGRG